MEVLNAKVGRKRGLGKGQAAITASGVSASAFALSRVRYMLRKDSGPAQYLSGTSWTDAPFWLVPERTEQTATGLTLVVGPNVVRQLRRGERFRLGVSLDGQSLAANGFLARDKSGVAQIRLAGAAVLVVVLVGAAGFVGNRFFGVEQRDLGFAASETRKQTEQQDPVETAAVVPDSGADIGSGGSVDEPVLDSEPLASTPMGTGATSPAVSDAAVPPDVSNTASTRENGVDYRDLSARAEPARSHAGSSPAQTTEQLAATPLTSTPASTDETQSDISDAEVPSDVSDTASTRETAVDTKDLSARADPRSQAGASPVLTPEQVAALSGSQHRKPSSPETVSASPVPADESSPVEQQDVPDEATETVSAARTVDRADLRQLIESAQDAGTAFGEAQRLLADGQTDWALVLYKQAAGFGSAEAATEIARMYDPTLFGSVASPFTEPNMAKAVEWYQVGAASDHAEAVEGLAALVDWLSKKEAGGDQEAARLLGSL